MGFPQGALTANDLDPLCSLINTKLENNVISFLLDYYLGQSIVVLVTGAVKLPLKNIETSSFPGDLFDVGEKFYRFVYFRN